MLNRRFRFWCLFLVPFLLSGCIKREIQITSNPSGAYCEVNGRHVGETPLKIKYVENGEFKLLLKKENYSYLFTSFRVKKNWHDYFILDFFGELVPYNIVDKETILFTLQEEIKPDHATFKEELRQKVDAIKNHSGE